MEQRNHMLNLLKGIGCVGVVFIHVPFPGMIGTAMAKLAQFTVPIFAMIAGYYALNCDEAKIKKRLFRMCHIFLVALVWWLLYAVLMHFYNGDFIQWVKKELSIVTIVKFFVFINLDFAIPLWYLIGMIETYIVWFMAVKFKKEKDFVHLMPLLFLLQFVLTTYCETKGLPWSFKINFITRILAWFLLGYKIHDNEDNIIGKVNGIKLVWGVLLGEFIAFFHVIFKSRLDFSCVGIFLVSASLFIAAIKYKDISVSKTIEYLGDKLSLNVYIFHSIIAWIFVVVAECLLPIDTANGLFPWINPVLTAVATIFLAQIIEAKKN
ncbi:acyltransferase family protein [Butyrivibrio sp. JL13D10]|uniref:acyltransferase family protein n=1 Tax=Butyrivibrio sp. JL13D10 TaxID=3236815 RepID=UPI0038B4A35F